MPAMVSMKLSVPTSNPPSVNVWPATVTVPKYASASEYDPAEEEGDDAKRRKRDDCRSSEGYIVSVQFRVRRSVYGEGSGNVRFR